MQCCTNEKYGRTGSFSLSADERLALPEGQLSILSIDPAAQLLSLAWSQRPAMRSRILWRAAPSATQDVSWLGAESVWNRCHNLLPKMNTPTKTFRITPSNQSVA